MRSGLVAALLLFVGCGSNSPTTPTAPSTQRPPSFPNMLGGWGGTLEATISAPVRSTATCNLTVLVTTQNAGEYSGSYQRSGVSNCTASAGTLTGTVNAQNQVAVRLTSTTGGNCSLRSGPGFYSGALSQAGTITAFMEATYFCNTPVGSFEQRTTEAITLSRR